MARQITVLMENEPGALSEVTGVLSKAGINIESLMVEAEHDFGYARLQVHPHNEALRVLEEAGFQVRGGDILTLKLANKPGALHEILADLGKAKINVEFLFGTASGEEEGELVMRVDDTARAKEILDLD